MWLTKIDEWLSAFVGRIYAHDLQSKSLKDIQPQLAASMDSLLTDLAVKMKSRSTTHAPDIHLSMALQGSITGIRTTLSLRLPCPIRNLQHRSIAYLQKRRKKSIFPQYIRLLVRFKIRETSIVEGTTCWNLWRSYRNAWQGGWCR